MVMHVLFDFGGPVMDDIGVEHVRAEYEFEAASRSGIYERIAVNAERLIPGSHDLLEKIDGKRFAEIYPEAKQHLKNMFSGAEAYSDINRVGMTAALLLGTSEHTEVIFGRVIEDISEGEIQRFWGELCSYVEPKVYEGIREEFFDAVSEILDSTPGVGVHIVTDNWPEFYLGAIEPALRRRIEKARERGRNVPRFAYRHFGEEPISDSHAYISGEGWGNKINPKTWKNILVDDLNVCEDRVIFVDDSLKKLGGLRRFADEYRDSCAKALKVTLVQFSVEESEEEIRDEGVVRIANIYEVVNIVGSNA